MNEQSNKGTPNQTFHLDSPLNLSQKEQAALIFYTLSVQCGGIA